MEQFEASGVQLDSAKERDTRAVSSRTTLLKLQSRSARIRRVSPILRNRLHRAVFLLGNIGSEMCRENRCGDLPYTTKRGNK